MNEWIERWIFFPLLTNKFVQVSKNHSTAPARLHQRTVISQLIVRHFEDGDVTVLNVRHFDDGSRRHRRRVVVSI